MDIQDDSLLAALGIGPASCIALIGAGGKTTTMLRLARALAASGKHVLITTTTKIWPPAGVPLVLDRHEADPVTAVRSLFTRAPIVALAHELGPEGKLHGVGRSELCRMAANEVADAVLCEADGAAGLPLKAHRAGEPVVPACATHLLVLAGVDAVGMEVAKAVHRPEIFVALVDSGLEDVVRPLDVARALLASARFTPAGARLVYVLSKVEGSAATQAAHRVVESLASLGNRHPVLLTCQGRVVAVGPPAGSPAAG